MYQYQLRYHTNLYSSLQDQQSPSYSNVTTRSSFKEMTKMVYRINFLKFEKLLRNRRQLPGTFLPSPMKQNASSSGFDEKELFAWKSGDDLNDIFSRRDFLHNAQSNDMTVDDVMEDQTEEEDIWLDDSTEESLSIEELNEQFRSFTKLCGELDSLDLIYRTKDVLEDMLCGLIEERIESMCDAIYDKPQLRRSTRWLYSSLYAWLQLVLPPETAKGKSRKFY